MPAAAIPHEYLAVGAAKYLLPCPAMAQEMFGLERHELAGLDMEERKIGCVGPAALRCHRAPPASALNLPPIPGAAAGSSSHRCTVRRDRQLEHGDTQSREGQGWLDWQLWEGLP